MGRPQAPEPAPTIARIVKGLEKLTSIRLAEALTQREAIPNDAITDALYSQDRHGESFVEALIATGHITEWDLAKMVVEQFQVPFLMASSYEIGDSAKTTLPKELLFESLIVPLDRFEDVLTIVMPILTPIEVLNKVRKASKCQIFPYVGLISENRNVLGTLYSEFSDWQKAAEKRREKERLHRSKEEKSLISHDWTSIFDSGDEQVQSSLKKKGP